MKLQPILDCLECDPVIAAIRDDRWQEAIDSPAQVLFYLSAEVLTVAERIRQAHEAGKYVLVHADLAEGSARTGQACGIWRNAVRTAFFPPKHS